MLRHVVYGVAGLALMALAGCSEPATDEAPTTPAPETGAGTDSAGDAQGGVAAADTVFWGGPIYTLDPERPRAEAVAVADGRIRYVGPAAGAQVWVGPDTRIIDLDGAAMYPGFTDSHVHVLGVGLREVRLNLDQVGSIAELQAVVAEAVAESRPEAVISGRGWIETHWPEDRFPTRDDLDAVAPDNPVILRRADGHALVANSAALDAAGITADSVAPDGGEILFDEAGEPTGMLIDTAMGPVAALVAAPVGEERGDIYVAGAERLASLGWTGGHDMSVPYDDVAMIEALAENGRLPIRSYVSINPDGYARLAEEAPRIADDGRVITRAVKLYMDGALGSRGAALLEPYADRPDTSGLTIAEPDETIGLFTEALRDGVQMNVHAIGDRGNRLLLDWVEEAMASVPPGERSGSDHRWRDEHSQIVNIEDIPRFSELGVIASVQPSHAIGDLHFAPDRLGDERLVGAYAWQSLLEAGARLTGGSDAPVEQGDPRIEFYAAVARSDLSGYQGENWHPEEALSREQALHLFTMGPAYASFREDELGSIEQGKRADFSVFSSDIMVIPAPEILEVEPVMTVVDGEIVWSAD
ncbi:amidohydrolase [Maricaulis sp. CAU 1757]